MSKYEKGYSSPEAAPVPILDRIKRTVKHENREKFKAFVNAAGARKNEARAKQLALRIRNS